MHHIMCMTLLHQYSKTWKEFYFGLPRTYPRVNVSLPTVKTSLGQFNKIGQLSGNHQGSSKRWRRLSRCVERPKDFDSTRSLSLSGFQVYFFHTSLGLGFGRASCIHSQGGLSTGRWPSGWLSILPFDFACYVLLLLKPATTDSSRGPLPWHVQPVKPRASIGGGRRP
jgi:hypothetical protein